MKLTLGHLQRRELIIMATTRLDRLILLLDTGSSAATRKVAAEQVGEIVKLHPQDLQKLLCRLHTMLRSSSPHTRTAVGQAIAALAKNVPKVNRFLHGHDTNARSWPTAAVP